MAAAQRYEEYLVPQAIFKHPKLNLAVRPSKALFVAGNKVDGVLELSCSSDKAWLGRIGLEIRGVEQLQSLDHAASHTFLQAEVAFQSPQLPPSNAVISTTPSSGGYWPGRKGVTRFPFSFDLSANCPSSCVFGNNASITYALQGTVHIQYQGERQVLTKRIELLVVEKWSDWQAEQFHELSDAQKRERVTAGLGFGSEGSVWVEASIPDPFFFRGWEIGNNASAGSGNVERERARGEVGINLAVKNATSKTICGVKLTLIRRMTILPNSAAASAAKGNMADGLRISEIASEISLIGREWEFPAGGEERRVQCWTDLAKPEKLLSIRKTRLFQVQTLVKVNLDMGTWHKDLSLELPIWVAHWASLPQAAFVQRQPAMPIADPQWISPPHSPSAYSQYAMARPASAQPCSPPFVTSPAVSSPSFSPALQLQQSPVQDHYISFDPYAPALTQSTFISALNSPQPASNWQAQQMARPTSAMDGRQYAPPVQYSSSVPSTTFFQQPVPFQSVPQAASPYYAQPDIPRSQSAQSYNTWQTAHVPARDTVMHNQRPLSPQLREYLSAEDQARVLANSMPTHYDVGDRGRMMSHQQMQPNYAPEGGYQNRRQSMPAPSSHVMERSNSFNRPNKTPPLARSSSSRFDVVPSQDTFTSFPSLPAQMHTLDGLETIGEDGESQAGTLRIRNGSGFLVRSASRDNVRSLRAVRAVGSADEGNTSASLLEALVDKQDREKEASRSSGSGNSSSILAEMDAHKTLPPPPVPTGKEDKRRDEKRRVFDIFPNIEAKGDTGDTVKPASLPAKSTSSSNRRTSAPLAKTEVLPRPIIRASNSESLLALETRLSRPSSPASANEPPAGSMTISPPLRTRTASPEQRAISPMHTGNAGALRKKSSQVALKQKVGASATAKASEPSYAAMPNKQPVPSARARRDTDKKADAQPAERPARAGNTISDLTDCPTRIPRDLAAGPTSSTPTKAKPKDRDLPSPLPSPAFAHVSPTPIRSRENSPAMSPKLKPPGPQRSVSDPQPSPLQTKSKNVASPPGVPEKKRPAPEVLLGGVDGGTAYDVRSARGGRGGRVTNVASQWASLIAENDKSKASKPASQTAEAVKIPKVIAKAEIKPVAKLDNTRTVTKPSPASIAKTASPSPLAKLSAPPKGTVATTFLNNTIGKPPTFASARPKAALPVNTAPITSTSSEQAQGLGAQRLKALIEKFN